MTLISRLFPSRLRRSSEPAVPLAEDDDRTLHRKDGVRIVQSQSSAGRAQVKRIDVSEKTERPVSPENRRPPGPTIKPCNTRGISVLLGLSRPSSAPKNKPSPPPPPLSSPSPASFPPPPPPSLLLDFGDIEAPLPASPLSHHSSEPATLSSAVSPFALAPVPDASLSTAPSSPVLTASPIAQDDDDHGVERHLEPRSKFSSWSSLASSFALDPTVGGAGALVDNWRWAVHELGGDDDDDDDGGHAQQQQQRQRANELVVARAFDAPNLTWSYPELAVALVGVGVTRQRGRRASTGGVSGGW
ncbi:hypothetical protein JCM5296_005698 [Sporobolomyces johnsonii]